MRNRPIHPLPTTAGANTALREVAAALAEARSDFNAVDFVCGSAMHKFLAAHAKSKLLKLDAEELLWRDQGLAWGTVQRLRRLASLYESLSVAEFPVRVKVLAPLNRAALDAKRDINVRDVYQADVWRAVGTKGVQKLCAISGKNRIARMRKALAALLVESALYDCGPLRPGFVRGVLLAIGEAEAARFGDSR